MHKNCARVLEILPKFKKTLYFFVHILYNDNDELDCVAVHVYVLVKKRGDTAYNALVCSMSETYFPKGRVLKCIRNFPELS